MSTDSVNERVTGGSQPASLTAKMPQRSNSGECQRLSVAPTGESDAKLALRRYGTATRDIAREWTNADVEQSRPSQTA